MPKEPREDGAGRYRDFVERCPSLVVELAPDGTTRVINPATERLLGMGRRELVGKPWWIAAIPPDWHDAATQLANDLRASDVVGRELPVSATDGPRWIEWTSANQFSPDGALQAVLLFGLDVTERRAADDAARRLSEERNARTAADSANRIKSEFLANMSHELRTPLHAIAGHVELLTMGLYGPVTTEQRDALNRMRQAQRHLLALINDILNYAKIESGHIEYELQPTDAIELIREICAIVEAQVRAKSLELHLAGALDPATSRGTESSVRVWADRDKLAQILLNLLSNAIKFTPPRQPSGEPGRITLELIAPADVHDIVYLSVRDTGIGVPAERQAAIFDPFVQVRTEPIHEQEGTGLGLAISRDLARGMGGDVRVRSLSGVGSTFTVTLRRTVSAGGEPLDRRFTRDRRQGGARHAPDQRQGR